MILIRKLKVGIPYALSGVGLILGSLLFFVTPLARPDGLGELLFLITVLLPWYRDFDNRSLVLSAICGLLAFLAKPYFVLSLGIIAAYTFLFVSKKRGILFGIGAVGLLVLILSTLNIFFEYYFLDVIMNNQANSSEFLDIQY